MLILNRYIRSQVVWSTVIVVSVLIGVESFIEFVSQLSDIGVGDYGVLQAMRYVPLQLPTDLYQLFPMAGFLGSLIGLGRLASNSELVVMRAAGVSILEIAISVIKAAIIMIIVVTAIGEGLAPHWQAVAAQLKAVAMHKSNTRDKLRGIWLRENNSYINIAAVSSPELIQGITQFDFDQNDRLKDVIYADNGKKVNDRWQLYQVQYTQLTNTKVVTKTLASQPFAINFEPRLLKQVKENVDHESIGTLFHNILYRRRTGLVTSEYQYAFWRRVIQPITTIVMICLGIPFIFGSLRSSSTGLRVMTGVIVGFSFYMLNQFFGPITLVYQFPPLLAAALPTVLFVVVYAILLKRIV